MEYQFDGYYCTTYLAPSYSKIIDYHVEWDRREKLHIYTEWVDDPNFCITKCITTSILRDHTIFPSEYNNSRAIADYVECHLTPSIPFDFITLQMWF